MKILNNNDDTTDMDDNDNGFGLATDLGDPTITEEDLRWAYPDITSEGDDGEGEGDEEEAV
jgi:hypothetical protein